MCNSPAGGVLAPPRDLGRPGACRPGSLTATGVRGAGQTPELGSVCLAPIRPGRPVPRLIVAPSSGKMNGEVQLNDQTPSTMVTTTALLNALSAPDNQEIWTQFTGRYRPVLIGFAKGLGLNETDAEDIAQQTLAAFAKDLRDGKYVRGKGRLRSWMLGIARHRAIDRQREMLRRRQWRGDSVLVEAAEERVVEDVWNEAQRATIFQQALEILQTKTRLSPATLEAFQLSVLRGVPTAEVARQCGISESEVYVAKSRVAAKLREIVEQLQDAYDRED